jgi:hypothetical protein
VSISLTPVLNLQLADNGGKRYDGAYVSAHRNSATKNMITILKHNYHYKMWTLIGN